MLIFSLIISTFLSATSVIITEPIDGESYDGDWLTIRAIVENENQLPDSVHYALNGSLIAPVPRLNTDWPTYMQNYQNHGYSESPAPIDNTIFWTAPVTGTDHEFPTPVVVNGIVYYPSNYGSDSLYALNSATGELIWKYYTGYTDDAVTVDNGRLFTASDSLWCLDALSGERLWATALAGPEGGTPVVSGNKVYAALRVPYTRDTSVSCFDVATGTQIWSDTVSGRPACCMSLQNETLFLATYSPISASPLYALDANTGSVIWANEDSPSGYWDSSPVVVDSVIYICGFDGIARGIDSTTGTTLWAEGITAGVHYIAATPAYAYGELFFADQVSSFHCLDALTGIPVWSTPGVQHGSSGIADGIVFYGEGADRAYGRLVALSCESGDEIWSYQTGGTEIFSSPAITDGVVYIAGMDSNLYAFGTGLKYTYLNDLYAQVGLNELIVTSFDGGAVAADTISFTVTETGINLEPSQLLGLSASPNPFTAATSISFEIFESGLTSIAIFDLTGRTISVIQDQELLAGKHTIQWDGIDQNGNLVSAGLYLCRIESGGIVETTGMCLLR
ncbi:MAG: PQQ-binding-like beta-propeller repeat protein [Candidatus Sabulitectum sp.]|nr:PQQ-binding-like beta-propeller repeat protein [Candidatus Sabulitectum sp.]